MSDRLAESRWLYNQPSSGRVANWWDRNKARFNGSWIDPQILDGAFILGTTSQDTDSSAKIRYSQDLVLVSKNGPEVPKEGSELWQIWQNYSQSEAGKADFNGSKLHLHGYSPFLTDRELRLQFSGYDWHRMRSLGLGLNDGTVPEHYRDGILPTLRPKGFVFEGEHPNNAVVQGIVITQDNHLVLTTKATSADYHAGSISPSFEEQLNGQKDNSPFDTYLRAVSSSPKLRRGEELKLNVDADSIRLMGLALEPEFNAAGFIMLGKCQQNSSEIDQSVFGIDQAEFDPSRPIWTLPLDPPDQLTKEFFQPSLKWHGVGRLRVITALSYVNGYEETLDMLYKQSQVI